MAGHKTCSSWSKGKLWSVCNVECSAWLTVGIPSWSITLTKPWPIHIPHGCQKTNVKGKGFNCHCFFYYCIWWSRRSSFRLPSSQLTRWHLQPALPLHAGCLGGSWQDGFVRALQEWRLKIFFSNLSLNKPSTIVHNDLFCCRSLVLAEEWFQVCGDM